MWTRCLLVPALILINATAIFAAIWLEGDPHHIKWWRGRRGQRAAVYLNSSRGHQTLCLPPLSRHQHCRIGLLLLLLLWYLVTIEKAHIQTFYNSDQHFLKLFCLFFASVPDRMGKVPQCLAVFGVESDFPSCLRSLVGLTWQVGILLKNVDKYVWDFINCIVTMDSQW